MKDAKILAIAERNKKKREEIKKKKTARDNKPEWIEKEKKKKNLLIIKKLARIEIIAKIILKAQQKIGNGEKNVLITIIREFGKAGIVPRNLVLLKFLMLVNYILLKILS